MLSIMAIKDGYEDIKRHQSDRQVNHSQAHVLMGGDCVNTNMNSKKSRTFASGDIPRQCPEWEDVEADATTKQDPDIEYDHMDSMEEGEYHMFGHTSENMGHWCCSFHWCLYQDCS
jgi:phospholipid-translocating ATPase